MIKIKRIDEFAAQMVNEMAVRPDVFKDYDEVDIFDSTYFIVKNGNGQYNLIDRNGNLISDIWFDKITKNDDGTVETVVKDNGNKSHAATYSDPKEFEVCVGVQKDLLDGISLPVGIDFDDIIPVTPYPIKTDTKNTVTIIAKVMLDGKELLLGKDGKLYNADGSLYIVNDASPIAANDIVKKYKLVYNKQTELYDCNGDIEVGDDLVSDGKFIIKFGVVSGNFVCYGKELTSLVGAPREVGGSFSCTFNRLTSLVGAPQKVGGNFECETNYLTSLEGAPQKVGGCFWCGGNTLTSLKGAPQEVGKSFDCSDSMLTSLKGAPQKVGKGFFCNINELTSLEGAPQKVGGDFECWSNHLTTLEGAPQEVNGHFWCYRNDLTSLEGAPQKVGGNFDCEQNPLTSFNGLPETINGDFNCGFNMNKEWSVAQKICALAIINRDSFEINGNMFFYDLGQRNDVIPQRFGNFDGGCVLFVNPCDELINDMCIEIRGYDTDGNDNGWNLSAFNKKEQLNILDILIDKFKK